MNQPMIPRIFRPATLLLFALFAAPAFAATPQSLPAWEQLTDAQREQLLAPIRERWNAAPDERARMFERAGRWQQMSPEKRRRAHRGVDRWRHMSPEQRTEARALYSRMRSLEPDGREALKARWRTMTTEQRKAWVSANPAPKRGCEE